MESEDERQLVDGFRSNLDNISIDKNGNVEFNLSEKFLKSKKKDLKEAVREIEELEKDLALLKDENAIRIIEREIRRRITALVLRAVVEDCL